MCGKSDNLTPSSPSASPSTCSCSCSDKPSPRLCQADATTGKFVTAASAAVAAGGAAGVIHYVLTGLYTNMTLGKAIACVVHNNNELGDAVNKSDLPSPDKESIKAALVTINDNLQDKKTQFEDIKAQFKTIKAQLDIIKAKLNGGMPELMQGLGQAYRGLAFVYSDADNTNITQQSFGAGLTVGALTGLGSFFAGRIQTAINDYLNPTQLGGTCPRYLQIPGDDGIPRCIIYT